MGKADVRVFDMTYSDRMADLEIARLVGRPFGVFSKERWAGIGSERCRITHASGEIEAVLEGDFGRNFTNIEIRPKGIILRIRYRLEVYGVAIPFDELIFEELEEGLKIGNEREHALLIGSHGKPVKEKFRAKLRALLNQK